ncbi:hypothetical protein [Zhongshania sp.]|uniref:hypothetical protein n=1 Tax=Zhongshania sp. TaxID=1971902 RepID=UPI003563E931
MIHKSEIKVKDPIRAEIEAQVAEYLSRGGKIKQAPSEVRQGDEARVKSFLHNYEGKGNE